MAVLIKFGTFEFDFRGLIESEIYECRPTTGISTPGQMGPRSLLPGEETTQ